MVGCLQTCDEDAVPNRLFVIPFFAAFLALHFYLKAHQPLSSGIAVGSSIASLPQKADNPLTLRIAATAQSNRITVINFFETWCGPCKVELPAMEKLYAQHKDAGLGMLGIYGTSSDGNIDVFAHDLGLSFPLLRDDDGSIAAAYQVEAVPTTVVVDATLHVLDTATGFNPLFSRQIETLLQKATSP